MHLCMHISKRALDQAAAKPCGQARGRTARCAAARRRQQGELRGQDTQALRDALPGLGLIAFVGDGAVLPRHAPLGEDALLYQRRV